MVCVQQQGDVKTKMQLILASGGISRLVRSKVQLISLKYPYISIKDRISCTFDANLVMSLVSRVINCTFVFKWQMQKVQMSLVPTWACELLNIFSTS